MIDQTAILPPTYTPLSAQQDLMARQTSTIRTLVQGFATHIRELKAPDYKEATVRAHYIDPFWKLLGWDVDNERQQAPQDIEVCVEPSLDTVEDDGLRSREPDYLFRVNGFPRFIVEAKKPAVDIESDKKAIYQAKRYAWNATIPFAVLTDFEDFRLYDTTLKPVLNEPARGLVREFSFHFTDYPAKWQEFVETFGRDAVADGALERLRARIRKISPTRRLRAVDRTLFELRGDEPVDRVFLNYLEKYRQHLARAIYHDNKQVFPEANTPHGAARLTEAVQRLIDRLVFMRVCEDRGVSRYGSLRDMLGRISSEGGEFYRSLCAEFRDLDRRYNGYLFKHHFVEELQVADEILADLIRTLYPPDGPWDFRKISDDILGIVYERFLGSVVTVRHGQADVVEKDEVRHAGGVYYTPRFVVDTIVRRVVGPQIAGKAPAELGDVKILDPACGSGSFLVAAFQYLIDHCVAAVAADPALAKVAAPPKWRKKHKEIAFRDRHGAWHLAPDFKAALLTNCIHGVDIDQQAVEVTVMSLYLKMLEGVLPPNWQRDWLENELLPPLDNNVLCGNSLIDSLDFDRYVVATHGGLFPADDDIRFRMNRFDWTSRTRGFGRILEPELATKLRGRAGFDCVIGNPPYIRVQELNKWAPDECEFYKWRYRSAAKGNYDIYVVFVERCLELLAPDGLLGFIMPHKFWQAKYGEGLRKIVAEGRHLRSVIDFGDQQVFRGATTYTGVHVFGRVASDAPIRYAKVTELVDGDAQCRAIDAQSRAPGVVAFNAQRGMPISGWSFFDARSARVLNVVTERGVPLGRFAAKVFVGLQTSADRVFILAQRDSRYFSDELQREVELEPTLLHPLLKGSVHMRRWVPLASDQFVLFPYERTSTGFRILSETSIRRRTPKTWTYLEKCRTGLSRRERGTYEGPWYGYVYPKNLASMGLPKILTPSLARRGEFCMDRTGDLFFVGSGGGGGGGYGILLDDPSIYDYVVGLLNSSLLNWFLQKITTPFHSGWFAYNKQFIEQIPIKLPETAAERKLADRIVQLVHEVVTATKKLRGSRLSDRERGSLNSEVEAHERRIDEAVFRLYGVDGLPG